MLTGGALDRYVCLPNRSLNAPLPRNPSEVNRAKQVFLDGSFFFPFLSFSLMSDGRQGRNLFLMAPAMLLDCNEGEAVTSLALTPFRPFWKLNQIFALILMGH